LTQVSIDGGGRKYDDRVPPRLARQLLFAKTGEALDCLVPPALQDERIHAARKALKSARAALRLLRPQLGETAYVRANFALRDAARDLSPLRDARSLLGALDLLGREEQQRKPVKAALARVRPLLQARLKQAHENLAAHQDVRNHCIALVSGCRKFVRATLDEQGDADRLLEAFRRIYGSAVNALRRAERARSDELLHEWRKQTKYLLTAATLLRRAGLKDMRGVVERADRIASHLGDDHDLAVLRLALLDSAAESDTGLLLPLIERRRVRLRRRAFRDGAALFARIPHCVVTHGSQPMPTAVSACDARDAASAPLPGHWRRPRVKRGAAAAL
jgi:CHAD domain-containing protein